jgi:ribosomal protein S27AE
LSSIPKRELHHLIDKLPEQQLARAKRYLEMLAHNNPPNSAAVPRPDNKPYYIDSNCPKCGTLLVLADLLEEPHTPNEKIWYDEFICPKCRNGIFLDLPESEIAEIEAALGEAPHSIAAL